MKNAETERLLASFADHLLRNRRVTTVDRGGRKAERRFAVAARGALEQFAAGGLECRVIGGEVLALGGATGRVVLGVEVENDAFIPIVAGAEPDIASARQFEIGNDLVFHIVVLTWIRCRHYELAVGRQQPGD